MSESIPDDMHALTVSPLARGWAQNAHDARQRDANRLRAAARAIEALELPEAETHAGRTAIASVRRWQLDLAAGCRGHAQTLES